MIFILMTLAYLRFQKPNVVLRISARLRNHTLKATTTQKFQQTDFTNEIYQIQSLKPTFASLKLNILYNLKLSVFKFLGGRTYHSENEEIYDPNFAWHMERSSSISGYQSKVIPFNSF